MLEPNSLTIFLAICAVESAGRLDAYNSREQAAGPAQIRPAYLQDANQWLLAHGLPTYRLSDRFQLAASHAICRAYWARYKCKTDEQRARCHNGGPLGMKKKATLPYWNKVQKHLRKART